MADDVRTMVRKTLEKMRGDSDRMTATVAQIKEAMPGPDKSKPSNGSINYHLKALEQAGIFKIISQGARHPLEYVWTTAADQTDQPQPAAQEAPQPAQNGKGKGKGGQSLSDRFQVVKDALTAEQAHVERIAQERDQLQAERDQLQAELDQIVSAVTEGLAKAS